MRHRGCITTLPRLAMWLWRYRCCRHLSIHVLGLRRGSRAKPVLLARQHDTLNIGGCLEFE